MNHSGILLTNLGTPDAPTAEAVRRYLAEFLWDKNVVGLPRWIWWPVLHGIILRRRPPFIAEHYKKIWTPEGSPLLFISEKQGRKLQQQLEYSFQEPPTVVLGMRYGNPSLASSLEQLKKSGVTRIITFPLYPQYSVTTTKSTKEAVISALGELGWAPDVSTIAHYYNHPAYIAALANSIQEYRGVSGKGELLLFSFHGIPKRLVTRGDPYYDQCLKTARSVVEKLGLEQKEWRVTFQSKFGFGEWLSPATEETLRQLARDGLKSVDVICPGFSADCLETLEEIADMNRDVFLSEGGEQFHYIPALNDRPDHIQALVDIIKTHINDSPGYRAVSGTPAT